MKIIIDFYKKNFKQESKEELNRNSKTEDLLKVAKNYGFGDEDCLDASPSWISQELNERGIYKA